MTPSASAYQPISSHYIIQLGNAVLLLVISIICVSIAISKTSRKYDAVSTKPLDAQDHAREEFYAEIDEDLRG
ncbi:unnamed protein product [Bursaphelenchus okinawaensis]|uniref:Uncharacterized protein n=1 Tax=Bursaphelenchus okinawaensis TaxID=465554 RepID=A0A811K7Z9_9BILA|nr:unnamed protein product [Bursaphelenchus okinawaensis]CAG9093511.1 unnamed protein product [Bursaphelenchus okinawaensis]